MLARFNDLVNLSIYITKMYRTKSNLPSKCDFKSDKDKKKHSLAPCEGIIKFPHTLLVKYFGAGKDGGGGLGVWSDIIYTLYKYHLHQISDF